MPQAAWCKRGDIFIDLFGGVGRVARCVSQRGGPNAIVLDFSYGYDILRPGAVEHIAQLAKAGRLKGIMLATPCNSFSAARRAPLWSSMPRKLRSEQHPHGIPGLKQSDIDTAEQGNAIVRCCRRIIAVCDKYSIPWIVENPRSSFLWKMPEMQSLMSCNHVRIHHCHQCQYGCPWMKATTFMTGNCQHAPQLERSCKPVKRRFCSRTGLAHFCLDNPSVTKQAQTYSRKLAGALAQTFKDAWIGLYIKDVSSAFGKVANT